jgi:hypothetical protein
MSESLLIDANASKEEKYKNEFSYIFEYTVKLKLEN